MSFSDLIGDVYASIQETICSCPAKSITPEQIGYLFDAFFGISGFSISWSGMKYDDAELLEELIDYASKSGSLENLISVISKAMTRSARLSEAVDDLNERLKNPSALLKTIKSPELKAAVSSIYSISKSK